jgi:hypothetical protein
LWPEKLGTGFRRASVVVVAAITLYMAIGAWVQHPLGWYASLVFAAWEPIEVAARFTWIRSGGRSAVIGHLVTSALSLCFLLALFTHSGRAAFRL